MMFRFKTIWCVTWLTLTALATAASACMPAATPPPLSPAGGTAPTLKVLAVETFLADIAQNVAGDRLVVTSLIPVGVDPHSFEPTPGDVRKVAESSVLIANGAGFEGFLARLLENAGGSPLFTQGGGERRVIEAATGLAVRTPKEGEQAEAPREHQQHEGDPHFWLDPNNVITYAENIRDGLSEADPGDAAFYAKNAETYIARLKKLDIWIADQVRQIAPERRLLVTNHESLGYFADRYGFRIVGTIIPSVSTGASPSAQQMAQLIDHIKNTGARAIFLETGANSQLAQQIAEETGVKVVTELYSHSTTEADGPAPTYIDMMEYNARAIVEALK